MESEDIEHVGAGNGPPGLDTSGQLSTAETEAAGDGRDRSPEQYRAEAAAEATPAVEATSTRRPLKLVVTWQPTDGHGYRALLALGADGCDPLFRSVAVADLRAALDEVPALIAEAEARWQGQPRYPTVVPQKAKTTAQRPRPPEVAKPGGLVSGQDSPTQPTSPAEANPTHPAPGPTAKPAPAGQLSLFQ